MVFATQNNDVGMAETLKTKRIRHAVKWRHANCAVTFLVSLACMGCYSFKLISENRLYPKRPNFVLGPFQVSSNQCLVDFSSVYCNHLQGRLADGRAADGYNFYRFWPNGRVYLRCTDHLPSLSDGESFSSAYMGYFVEHGSNITMEIYVGDRGYSSSSGVIDTNGLRLLKNERRTEWGNIWSYDGDSYFVRQFIGPMQRQPDW